MSATYILGDVRDVLATIPDGSIDLVLTSPPFLALRSYLPSDHPDKHREIGAEPGPAEFIDTLLGLTAEWRRVLAPHGSIAVELGDTYAGSGGGGGDYLPGGMREGQQQFAGSAATMRESNAAHWRQKNAARSAWPLDKSLTMVPELYRVALAYGINPLTGQPSPAGHWRARNVVRWCRPNPPVGALGDKVRPATSDMVIACTSRTRFFDLDAIRTPHTEPNHVQTVGKGAASARDTRGGGDIGRPDKIVVQNPAGAPPLDHWWADLDDDVFDQDAWLVSTEAYKGSHYATWPRKLLTRPILSMCPERVCTVCGEPSRRIVAENPDYEGRAGGPTHNNAEQGASLKGFSHKAYAPPKFLDTGAWSDCGHDSWRPGVVLDPFAGSGTTLAVATGHGRNAIGIDIDERNVDLARERVGPMFFDAITLDEFAARHQEVAATP